MRNLAITILALMLLSSIASAYPNALGQEHAENQITTHGSNHVRPQISGSTVVWQDDRGGNWDIYHLDLQNSTDLSETPVFSGPGNQVNPAVDGRIIVWEDQSTGQGDIYMYDLGPDMRLNTDDDGVIIAVCTNEHKQSMPDVHGDYIVWQDDRNGAERSEIYLYTISSGDVVCIPGNNGVDRERPAIWGEYVVWEEYSYTSGDFNSYLSYYHIPSDTVTRLQNSYEEFYPDISQNIIAFLRYDPATSTRHICTYNITNNVLSTISDLGSVPSYFGPPQIYGDSIVWIDETAELKIVVHQISTGDKIFLADNGTARYPAIGQYGIVWQDTRGLETQLYNSLLPIAILPTFEDISEKDSSGKSFHFRLKISYEGVVQEVRVLYSFNGAEGDWQNVSMALSGDVEYAKDITLQDGATELAYRFVLKDGEGNWHETQPAVIALKEPESSAPLLLHVVLIAIVSLVLAASYLFYRRR